MLAQPLARWLAALAGLIGWLVWLGWLADVHPRCDDYRSLPSMHDLDCFRGIRESRISVDHGRRPNGLRTMVPAQFCNLEMLRILLFYGWF